MVLSMVRRGPADAVTVAVGGGVSHTWCLAVSSEDRTRLAHEHTVPEPLGPVRDVHSRSTLSTSITTLSVSVVFAGSGLMRTTGVVGSAFTRKTVTAVDISPRESVAVSVTV